MTEYHSRGDGIIYPDNYDQVPGYDTFPRQQQPPKPSAESWVRPTLAADIAEGEPPIDPDDLDVIDDDNPDEK